tara:strand:+ start:53 stop:1009 length:957 start_codon:yes stop_codon:yes gene_type:complete
MSLTLQVDDSLSDFLNDLNLWDSFISQDGSAHPFYSTAATLGKSAWPPTARPISANADANLYPRILVESGLSGEVAPRTGVFSGTLSIFVQTKLVEGLAYIPTGKSSATSRPYEENGHVSHSALVGNVINHFHDNQAAWRGGIESAGRGVKVYDLFFESERQSDVDDGVVEAEIAFRFVAAWDGTTLPSDMPTGTATTLPLVVTLSEYVPDESTEEVDDENISSASISIQPEPVEGAVQSGAEDASSGMLIISPEYSEGETHAEASIQETNEADPDNAEEGSITIGANPSETLEDQISETNEADPDNAEEGSITIGTS